MNEKHRDKSSQEEHSSPLQTLREGFRRDVDELVELELDVEDLAERQASLLKQYIKADVEGAKHFWEELKDEIASWEGYIGQWVLQAANPTQLDWVRLDHYIEKGEGRLMAGEIASHQELVCVDCGKLRVVEGTVTIQPCSNCGSEMYAVKDRK